MRDARRGARARARPPVALRADARRPGRRGPHRARRRPPADDAGRPALARRRAARPGRGPARPRSTTTPSIAWPRPAGAATRSATGRGPGHESRHNLVYWQRRPYEAVGPGAHAFDGATRRWNAARLDGYLAALTPADGRGRACRRAASERDRPGDGGRRGGRSSGCGSTRACRSTRRHEPPLADVFGWALAAELLDVTDRGPGRPDDRGRLLSNELFAGSSDAAAPLPPTRRTLVRPMHDEHVIATQGGTHGLGSCRSR